MWVKTIPNLKTKKKLVGARFEIKTKRIWRFVIQCHLTIDKVGVLVTNHLPCNPLLTLYTKHNCCYPDLFNQLHNMISFSFFMLYY